MSVYAKGIKNGVLMYFKFTGQPFLAALESLNNMGCTSVEAISQEEYDARPVQPID